MKLVLSLFLSVSLVSFLSCFLASCDGKKAGQGEGEANIEELQTTVDDQLEKAKKLGLKSGEDYDVITKLVDDAKKAADDGKNDVASKKLKQAAKKLQAWTDDRKAVQEAVKKVAEIRAAAEQAKKSADAGKTQENAPDIYKQALDSLTSAQASLEKPASTKAVDLAKRDLLRAKELFEQAKQSAGQNELVKKQAETEKQEMVKVKEKAKSHGAQEKAENEWLAAEGLARDADAFMASGEFRTALDGYRQAAARYLGSYKDSVSADEFEKDRIQAAAADKEALVQLEKDQKKEAVAAAEREKAEVTAKPKAKADVVAQAPAIFLFEGFDPTKYPQDDSDAEDDALILEHIRKLSPKLEYDPVTAAVTIDYTIGVDVKNALKDDPSYKPLQQKQYILFEPPVYDRKVEIDDPVKRKKASPYSFAGNTQGVVAFPVPFRYYVRAEFKLSILTLVRSATFDCLVMYDRKKSDGYIGRWVNAGIMKGGAPKLMPLTGEHAAEYSKPADRWFPKTHEVPMLAEFRMPDPEPKRAGKDPLKTGLLTVSFEVGDDLHGATSLYPSKGEPLQRGLVGFQWGGAKFEVRNLQITGILDKKVAADILRAKLKLPKKAAKAEAKEKKEEKAGGGDAAGGDESDPPEDDGSKKKSSPKKAAGGGGFDF
jgi:hypothetical protein